ncbi:MAG TPA: NAD(P)/FAD-dependent oxidoreductase [Thermohalobaculum sp.]|nr:NAD(P)/FAD-dependent oxidoreductase [Thermohalobaculum sp.]
MNETHTSETHATGVHTTDVCIIGAGPVGLFAVFELGLLDMRCHVIDILDRPGGQCAELYPEKPIYDIPAWPVISGQELVDRLMQQISPFKAQFHLNQMAVRLERRAASDDLPHGGWRVVTDADTRIDCKVVVIAAGGGSFVPKKPALEGIEAYEGESVFYSVRQMDRFKGRDVLVAGGGDSALDWVLNLAPKARSMALVHHRDGFRAAPDSVNRMRALVEAGGMDLHIAKMKALKGAGSKLDAVVVHSSEHGDYEVPCDVLLPFYGLTMKLGPVGEFGYEVRDNLIVVDTEKFETSIPGIFAIGDINHYPGKLKLILCGFHEAALMAQQAFHICFPDKKLRFQYTTSSSSLQRKLGV